MEKSNYALISALYSNSNYGLYSDIYFPIIKHAIVGLFVKREESHPYCSADDIHDYIVDKFGVSIPHIVISKSILKINAQKCGNIELVVFENGDTFQIQSASFDCDVENISEREQLFTEKIEIIEEKYQDFLNQEGSINDGISFIQFISDNTDDILGYFEEQDTSKVDERYVTMVFFLQYLSDYEKDLYQVANQLFWGSVIAGFLRSEKPLVDESENGINTEYFLDTSIMMGVLELSTPQREKYSKEVCDIIKAAGGILRVNPMTVDEISYILQSVEQNGPNPLTDIASACERRKLETNNLALIRLNLVKEIEKNGINVFPQMDAVEKQKKIQTFQGKQVTKLLAESRNKKPTSYSKDNYREIHDVFMDEFIKERRKSKGNNDQVFFLTANRDLIDFCKTTHPGISYMKSTMCIILELWMHNTKPVDISGCILTEAMARCLDLHSTRVRNKIAEVSRFYNKTKSDFNAEIYKDFIKKLYNRAKHVIQTVELDPDEIIEGEFGKLIREAVAADNLVYNRENAKVRKENAQLNESVISKEEEILSAKKEVERLISDNEEKQNKIIKILADRDKLSSELTDKEYERLQIEKEKNAETAAREKAERTNSLYKRRDELNNLINRTNVEIAPYTKSIEKCFCNWIPYFCFVSAAILVIGIFALWILLYHFEDSMIFFKMNSAAITTGVLTVAGMIGGIGGYFNSNDSVTKRRENAQKKWGAKSENAKYKILLKDLSLYNEELECIEKELKA